MISQAELLKTLVNSNCTDEGVMSTAMSPDCTPPKLMEKLTEAERFDLALDISMKLGLDVMPLWRTWALRCLRNRNFQGARDKFRHCFLRLRSPSGRSSPMQSKLLADILAELVKMDNKCISIRDEVEIIKLHGNSGEQFDLEYMRLQEEDDNNERENPNLRKLLSIDSPIFTECIHYLTDYGTAEDFIRFYVRNSLWDRAVETLIGKCKSINIDRFFISELLVYNTSMGHLSDFVNAFVREDPEIISSSQYFKALYDFCSRHKRYNLLYYVQTTIGDHIAAALTQINHFFLKKPAISYRELNQRMTNLVNARKDYQNYIDKLNRLSEKASASEESSERVGSSLLTSGTKPEIEGRIQWIDLQMEITRNFALNEVSGCMNTTNDSSEFHGGDNICPRDDEQEFPITVFDEEPTRRTHLVALVLIYFDRSCRSYFSDDGLKLANRLVGSYKLDKVSVFKTAMRLIIDDESCDILENASRLLDRIREDFMLCYTKSNLRRRASEIVTSKGPTNATNATSTVAGQRRQQPRRSIASRERPTTISLATSKGSQNDVRCPDSCSSNFSEFGLHLRLNEPAESQIRNICDEIIRDSIDYCKEPDYKMELAKLLSGEAKIELYIEHGKLSNAQRLAFNMNRADYVSSIIEEAGKLNQNHVKTVCQLWLAKHETKSPTR